MGPEVEYELYAGELGSGRTNNAPSSPISLEAGTDRPWLLIAVGTGLSVCFILIVALVVYRKRKAQSKTAKMFDVYDETELDPIDLDIAPIDPSVLNSSSSFPPPPLASTPPPVDSPSSNKTARAIYTFDGREADELSFSVGDSIEIEQEFDDGWAAGKLATTGAKRISPPPAPKPVSQPPPMFALPKVAPRVAPKVA